MQHQSKVRSAIHLAGWILLCLAAGVIGSFATQASVETWYPTLTKPWFTPPDALFGPVWTVLYILMGIAAFLVARQGWRMSVSTRLPIIVFLVQLALNAFWSVAFFGLQSIGGGLVVILLLWIAIFATFWLFHKINRWAGYLLIPYLLWVSYAAVLNAELLRLN